MSNETTIMRADGHSLHSCPIHHLGWGVPRRVCIIVVRQKPTLADLRLHLNHKRKKLRSKKKGDRFSVFANSLFKLLRKV